jgi:hypothetical protein
MWSGYLTVRARRAWVAARCPSRARSLGRAQVNATHGRALFFWFVESANANANTLVTWTNGGAQWWWGGGLGGGSRWAR